MASQRYIIVTRMLLGIMSIGIPLTLHMDQCPRTLAIHLHCTPIRKQSDSARYQPAMTWPRKLIDLRENWVHPMCPRYLRNSPRARIWKPPFFTQGIHRNPMEIHVPGVVQKATATPFCNASPRCKNGAHITMVGPCSACSPLPDAGTSESVCRCSGPLSAGTSK